MTRRGIVIAVTVIAAILASTSGWLWWNRHASDASLRALAEREIRHDLQRDFAAVELGPLNFQDFKIVHEGPTAFYSGKVTIPRSRFAVGWWQDPSTFVYFEPRGFVDLTFEGRAEIQRQHVAEWRSLGPIRPVWISWNSSTEKNRALFNQAWDRSATEGAAALFDAHLVSSDEFMFSQNEYQRWMQVVALRILTSERRYAEAIDMLPQDLTKPEPDDGPRYERQWTAVQELWSALQNEGIENASQRESLRKLLKR